MKISDEEIIAAILSCPTNLQAAEKCGLSEGQMYKRMREESFRLKYAEAKTSLLERATALMQSNMSEAVSTMAEIMRNDKNSPQVRLNAADAIIRNGIRLTEQREILERLEALERAQDG